MNRWITCMVLFGCVLLSCFSAAAETIAHWTFDGGTVGASLVSDTSAGSAAITVDKVQHGTSPPDAFYGEGPTGFGTALDLRANTGGVNNLGAMVYNLSSATDPLVGGDSGLSGLTVEAFVWLGASAANSNSIIRKTDTWAGDGAGFSENGYALNIVNGAPSFRLGASSYLYLTALTTLTRETWHHIAGTWDGDTGVVSLYIDGVLETTGSYTGTLNGATSNDGPVAIGGIIRDAAVTNTGQYFDGMIDELRISDVALTSDQFLVPEPSTWALLIVGALTLIGATWRRRR